MASVVERLLVSIGIKGTDKFTGDLKKARRAVEGETRKIESGTKGFAATLGRMKASVLSAWGAVAGIVGGATIAVIAKGVAMAEQNRLVGMSFERLAESAGQSSDDLLAAVNKGTQGTVSDLTAMQKVNQGLLLGLPITAASMENMAQVALRLGRAVGRNATEALDDLMLGLGRQSKMILDNLGLIVDTEQAYKDYAAQIGKTVEQLTEAERKQGFFIAGMEAARLKAGQLDNISGGLNEQWQRLISTAENLSAKIFSRLSPAFEGVLAAINKVVGANQAAGKSLVFVTDEEKARLESVKGDWEAYQRVLWQIAKEREQQAMENKGFLDGLKTGMLEVADITDEVVRRAAKGETVLQIFGDAKAQKATLAFANELNRRVDEFRANIKTLPRPADVTPGVREAPINLQPYISRQASRQDIARMIREATQEAAQAGGDIFDIYQKKLDRFQKGFVDTAEDGAEAFKEIPRKMEDEFQDALGNIDMLLMNTIGRGSGLTSGIGQLFSGLKGLGGMSEDGTIFGKKLSEGFMTGLKQIGFFSQMASGALAIGQTINGVIGMFFDELPPAIARAGQTESEAVSSAQQKVIDDQRKAVGQLENTVAVFSGDLEAFVATTRGGVSNAFEPSIVWARQAGEVLARGITPEQRLTELQAELAAERGKLQGLLDAPGSMGGADSGSRQYSAVITATSEQMQSLIGLTETIRVQDATRNSLIETTNRKLGNIEASTGISAGAYLSRFQG